MSASRIVFGICFLAFIGTLTTLSILVGSGERFQVISVLALSALTWGSMTYFSKTRIAHYRLFWISCTSISIVSYVLVFGSTVFYDEMSLFDSDSEQENQTYESIPRERALYQNPWLIYKIYSDALFDILDSTNSYRTHPIFLGAVLLSLALPVAVIISCYRCWKPIKQIG